MGRVKRSLLVRRLVPHAHGPKRSEHDASGPAAIWYRDGRKRAEVVRALRRHDEQSLPTANDRPGRLRPARCGDRVCNVARRRPDGAQLRGVQIDVEGDARAAEDGDARKTRCPGEDGEERTFDQLAQFRLARRPCLQRVRHDRFHVRTFDQRRHAIDWKPIADLRDPSLDGAQILRNVAVRLEIEFDFELPLIAIRSRGAYAGDRCKSCFERVRDTRADLLGRKSARIGENLNASERDRRKDALRSRDEAPASEHEAADYRKERKSRRCHGEPVEAQP